MRGGPPPPRDLGGERNAVGGHAIQFSLQTIRGGFEIFKPLEVDDQLIRPKQPKEIPTDLAG